ncbi:lipase member M-like isoform X2 [Crotalus tigris]|uniref:lipase member M-like isoform X2 n=1 Tax=Crotalus tigris TaxID=88082 RepID=UPI00192FB5D3|nr:lipase member M-like isoform X2 [Crotalus tigris]
MQAIIVMICLIHGFAYSKLIRTKRAANSEAFMNINELIIHKGYLSEEYKVMTTDGYILSLNRIPSGRNYQMDFDAGYDVWIGNSRGNTWSRSHQNLSVSEDEFWAFSFDEMAKYDLPAVVNFILRKTGQQQLYYVGYSQGAAIAFIAFSAMPELAQKIKMFFALAPVTRIKYAKSSIVKLLNLPERFLQTLLGKREFLPQKWLVGKALSTFCSRRLFTSVCGNIFFHLSGYNMRNINMSRINIYVARSPAGTSVQNILHWSQIFRCGLFKSFDWGDEMKNKIKHKQLTPPLYKVDAMTVPTAVWTGGKDLLSDPKDIAILLPQIKQLVSHKSISDWAHLDFIWGLDAPQRMYNEIIDLMKKHA